MLEISHEDSQLSCFSKSTMFTVVVFQLFIDNSNYFLYDSILDISCEKTFFSQGEDYEFREKRRLPESIQMASCYYLHGIGNRSAAYDVH